MADFRDPWVENIKLRDNLFNWQIIIEKKLEKMIINYADIVIANTETNKSNLVKRYQNQLRDKFITIHNGFDDYKEIQKIYDYKKFTITHTGIFYPQVSPYFFFEAIARWLKNHDKNVRSNIQILLIGENQHGETKKIVDKFELNDVVLFIERQPHKKALDIACSSDLLLVSLGFNTFNKGWIPMKIFDYLSCEKPILSFLPAGEAAKIIKDTGSGYVITNKDFDQVQSILDKEYLKKTSGLQTQSDKRNCEKISAYNNKNLAKKLAEAFDSLV